MAGNNEIPNHKKEKKVITEHEYADPQQGAWIHMINFFLVFLLVLHSKEWSDNIITMNDSPIITTLGRK